MRLKILSGLIVLFLIGIALEFTREVTAEDDATASTPADSIQIERGKLLVNYGDCGGCHTPKILSPEGPRPDMALEFAGHRENAQLPTVPGHVITPDGWAALGSAEFTAWAGPWGISYAANLTPDPETGIGKWTPEMFVTAMRTGQHVGGGRGILPPMPWYAVATLGDEDIRAIFAYLKSLPPVKNKVPDPVPPAAPGS